MHAAARILGLATIALAGLARADTVALIDGRVIQGTVSFDAKGALVVLPKNQPSQRVPIEQIVSVEIAQKKPKPAPCQITLVNGAVVAAEQVLESSERETRLKRPDGSLLIFPTTLVSSVAYRPVKSQAPAPVTGPGAMLVSGDFSEGEILQIGPQTVRVSSVLFGIQEFDPRKNVAAVYLRPVGVSKARFLVRTAEGSVLHAQSIDINNGTLDLTTDTVGPMSLRGSDVIGITLGPGAADDLATLAGPAAREGLRLEPGERQSLALDKRYRAVELTLGVPSAYVPTRAVRFIVALDGKPVAQTGLLTSLSPPSRVTFAADGASALEIRVEADAGPAALGVAGLVAQGRFLHP